MGALRRPNSASERASSLRANCLATQSKSTFLNASNFSALATAATTTLSDAERRACRFIITPADCSTNKDTDTDTDTQTDGRTLSLWPKVSPISNSASRRFASTRRGGCRGPEVGAVRVCARARALKVHANATVIKRRARLRAACARAARACVCLRQAD